MKKEESIAKISEIVDSILWNDWDPIAVNNVPEARDEYGSYVAGIVAILVNGVDELSLANHLLSIEKSSIGISSGPDHCKYVARKILDGYAKLA